MGNVPLTIEAYGYDKRQALDSLSARLETMNYVLKVKDEKYFVYCEYKKIHMVTFEVKKTKRGDVIIAVLTLH